MTWLTRFALLAGLFTGSATFAQTTTPTTTPTTTGGNTGNSSQNLGGNSGFTGMALEQSVQITGSNVAQGQVDGSNAFAATYANPLYAGRAGTDGKGDPGGFGVPMAGGGGGAGGRTTGSAANFGASNRAATANRAAGTNTGATGRTTGTNRTATGANTTTGTQAGLGFGGNTTGGRAAGAFGNSNNQMNSMLGGRNAGLGGNSMLGGGNSMFGGNSQQQGIVAQQPVPIAASIQIKFPVRPITTPQMHTDLNAALGRSSFLSNPRGISVQYDNKTVVLRGAVKDEEEARTAEGIVRLTPGVRVVKNELTYPATAVQP